VTELQLDVSSARDSERMEPRRALCERLLLVSAHDADALNARLEQTLAHLERADDDLADVAFTLTRGRRTMAHRACVVLPEAGSLPPLRELTCVRARAASAGPGSVAFMFPGQGAQFVGMGRGLYKTSARYRETFDRAAAILEPKLGFHLRELLLVDPERADSELEARLTQTSVAQPALFVVEYAFADLLMSYGVRPSLLIGHSIGEFAAACLAQVFSLEAALHLVFERGRLMGSMPSGAMLAVKCEPADIEELLSATVNLAAHNAPGLVVVSGPHQAIADFQSAAQAKGFDVRALHTSHAFHSAMMDPILDEFRLAVERAEPQPPRIPIVSTMSGQRLTDAEATSPEYWAKQLRNPVRFADAARTAADDPARIFVEVGPGVTLVTSVAKLVDAPHRPRKLIETLGHPKTALSGGDALLTCLGTLWLHGGPVDWDAFYGASARRLVRLPTYPYRRKRHWVEPPTAAASNHRPSAAASTDTSGKAAPANPATAETDPSAALTKLKALLESRLGRALDDADLDLRFLELGFDSLALAQLGAKIRQEFSLQVPVRLFFERLGTPRLLASHISAEAPPPRTPQPPPQAENGVHAAALPAGALGQVAPHDAGGSPARALPDDLRALDGRLSRIEALLQALLPTAATVEPAPLETTSSGEATRTDGVQELTASQREIWVATRIGGPTANLAYNECRAFLFDGELDEPALTRSLADLSARHEALRHTFSDDGSQCVTAPSLLVPVERHDLRTLAEDAAGEQARTLMNAEVATPFDLAHGPLLRGRLLLLAERESILVLCAHHVAVDGSSWEILIRELGELYSAHHEGRAPNLPPARAFTEYAAQEEQYRRSGRAAESEAFWVKHLAGQTEDLNLPTDRPRPALRTYRATRLDQQLSPELADAVRRASAKAAVTPQSFLLTAFEILIHRLSRQADFVCGVPTSGQAAAGMESLVGHCVHVLPLRCQIDGATSIRQQLAATQATMLDCLDHQRATFTEVLPKLSRPRDPSRPALIQVAFGMGRSQKRPKFAGLNTALRVVPRVSETFDLYVYATDNLGGVEVSWSYNKDLFDQGTIEVWQRCFSELVTAMTSGDLDRSLATAPLLASEDYQRTVEVARGPVVARTRHVPAHASFAALALEQPDRIAAIDRAGSHTFAALDDQANQIAHFLIDAGVTPGSLVAVCLDRSVELLAALIGIWRAGCGYVPLDPEYPQNRVHMILEDSAASLVLTTRSLRQQIPDHYAVQCLDEVAAELTAKPKTAPGLAFSPEDTAYVIFTSGSTGRPKGVEISQLAFENFLASMAREPGFGKDDCILALTTISFDISGLELFLPLVTGGRAVIVTREQAVNPRQLQKLLVDHGVTVMQATPATWQMLFDSSWPGDPKLKVLCGGEAFPRHLAEKFLRTCGEVWNVYGPTETTVWSTVKRITDAADITIGRPIDNTTLYVLDEGRALVPPGVHGELWIGGTGVAKGYLGRPDLTQDRFVQSPFDAAQRIYRTGDLARLRPNGEFECLGRADFQVKIRGFRIELGEIETAILAQAGIKTCVVVVREDQPGDKVLTAYVVPEPGHSVALDELRSSLIGRLPAYMVPSAYAVLDALPMTPNKKVDRKALPAPVIVQSEAAPSTEPEDNVERQVLEIWRSVLRVPTAGTRDNFYSVGGHSLLAIQLVEKVNAEFGVEVAVNDFFAQPTVEGLRSAMRRLGVTGSPDEEAPMSTPWSAPLGHKGLYCIQPGTQGGKGLPLFLVHGDQANGLLPPVLGPELEIWGYHHQGSEGERIQFPTVESLGKHAHGEWLHRHGERPCIVAGHSFGALVAYQIATLRERQGLPTPRTIIIDARHPSILGGRGASLGPSGLKARYSGVRTRRRAEQAVERALSYLDRGRRVPTEYRQDYILGTYHLAAYHYSPPELRYDLDILRSSEWTRWAPIDGWDRSAVGKIRRMIIEGSHLSIVRTEEGIRPVGRWLREVFDELDAHPSDGGKR